MRKRVVVGNRRGFTLIEVLIAMVVFAIGMLALAAMFVTQARSNVAARGFTAAVNLGQEVHERLRSEPFASGQLAAGAHIPDGAFLPVNPVDEMGTAGGAFPTIYTRAWDVQDGVPAPGPRTLPVTVVWTDEQGASHTVTFSGIRSNEPI